MFKIEDDTTRGLCLQFSCQLQKTNSACKNIVKRIKGLDKQLLSLTDSQTNCELGEVTTMLKIIEENDIMIKQITIGLDEYYSKKYK